MSIIEIAQAVAQGGAAVAVIVVVILFLKHLREIAADQSEERGAIHTMLLQERQEWREEREAFIGLVENHLHEQTQALTSALTKLNGLVRVAERDTNA